MSAPLLVDDRDGVRLITWNRPEALNAMSMELWDGTRDALDGVADADIGCVVLTGVGRAFNVGQDLAEFGDPAQADGTRGLRGLMRALSEVEVPLVAAVNGLAVGFGATLLPWCEVVIVSEDARMKVPFLSLGVTTEAGSSASLPAVMGPQNAARFVLTGDWMGADEMVACNMAWQAVPTAALLPLALAVAGQIAAQPREATRTTTRLLRGTRRDAWLAAADREYEEMGRLAGSPENLAAIERFFSRG